jgi:integrase
VRRKRSARQLRWEWESRRSVPSAPPDRPADTKSGAQLRPIGAAAARHLASQSRQDRCSWVFPANRGPGHLIGLPRVLGRLCARAGLKNVSVHTLRHSFAATAAELGFSELTIAGLLGHSVSGITARYAHVPDSALLAAADRVSARIEAALDGQGVAEVVSLRREAGVA